MEDSLQEKFLLKLEEKYGQKDEVSSRFGTTSFGLVAKDLCMSNSQFTKLIYGNATEGMYTRSMDNIDRLIEEDRLKEQLMLADQKASNLEAQLSQFQKNKSNNNKFWMYLLFSLPILVAIAWLLFGSIEWLETPSARDTQHPLTEYFDFDFNSKVAFSSPYLKESEVQDFCPGSAYEGIWSLEKPYKLPLPDNKPGVYYLGKSADVRMKVAKTDTTNGNGNTLLAYEYLINEIWVDTKRTPLSPKYFDNKTKQYTEEFENLIFEENPQFKKVATIHSFFINTITIRKDSIFRNGEPGGRFATDVDKRLAQQFEIDPAHILENVLSDLTTTNCKSFPNPFCDPNDITEGESVISFDCIYTIRSENLGFGGGYPYTKGFRLEKQVYSNNLTCLCEDEIVEGRNE